MSGIANQQIRPKRPTWWQEHAPKQSTPVRNQEAAKNYEQNKAQMESDGRVSEDSEKPQENVSHAENLSQKPIDLY